MLSNTVYEEALTHEVPTYVGRVQSSVWRFLCIFDFTLEYFFPRTHILLFCWWHETYDGPLY